MTKQMIHEKKFLFWLPVFWICVWEGSQMWIFFLCSYFSSCFFNRLVANSLATVTPLCVDNRNNGVRRK